MFPQQLKTSTITNKMSRDPVMLQAEFHSLVMDIEHELIIQYSICTGEDPQWGYVFMQSEPGQMLPRKFNILVHKIRFKVEDK